MTDLLKDLSLAALGCLAIWYATSPKHEIGVQGYGSEFCRAHCKCGWASPTKCGDGAYVEAEIAAKVHIFESLRVEERL